MENHKSISEQGFQTVYKFQQKPVKFLSHLHMEYLPYDKENEDNVNPQEKNGLGPGHVFPADKDDKTQNGGDQQEQPEFRAEFDNGGFHGNIAVDHGIQEQRQSKGKGYIKNIASQGIGNGIVIIALPGILDGNNRIRHTGCCSRKDHGNE